MRSPAPSARARAGAAAVVLPLLLALLHPSCASANLTFTVNSAADDPDMVLNDGDCRTALNECTLRAAIQESNADLGQNTIHFAIPSAGVPAITPATPLPPVTNQVTIDGRTQPSSGTLTARNVEKSCPRPTT